eukprot:m.597884 g.597884  ORF g.597884 m.597884 type:complete len:221 (+) comp58072_c0_seq12:1037-1699(+)
MRFPFTATDFLFQSSIFSAFDGQLSCWQIMKFDHLDATINAFKDKYIYSAMVATEKSEKVILSWLESLAFHTYDEHGPLHPGKLSLQFPLIWVVFLCQLLYQPFFGARIEADGDDDEGDDDEEGGNKGKKNKKNRQQRQERRLLAGGAPTATAVSTEAPQASGAVAEDNAEPRQEVAQEMLTAEKPVEAVAQQPAPQESTGQELTSQDSTTQESTSQDSA